MTKREIVLEKEPSKFTTREFEKTENDEKNIIREIEITKIIPNKYQPREKIKTETVRELAKSIDENGIIQPIIVRRIGRSYEIIAGERRFRAVIKLGLDTIPCIIRDMEDDQSAKLALIENIQREDLNIVEEAKAFKKILREFDYTQKELSREIGKSRSYIANTIRLLDLSEYVLRFILEDTISIGHGKVLLGIKDIEFQKEIADKIIKEKLTVRETENLIKGEAKKPKIKSVKRDEYLVSLENELIMSLGTKVNLIHGKDKGIIEIEYYGEEDLGRILNLIK